MRMMTGRLRGVVADLIMRLMMFGGVPLMNGSLNGVMMTAMTSTHQALLILQEHLFCTSKRKKEKIINGKGNMKIINQMLIKVEEVNQKVMRRKLKIRMSAKKMNKMTTSFQIQVRWV
ncbi:PREDICTED: uncharacterized protein LOC107333832 [Acropora digitifera]|uniref:uncharacterized protein LOC107333832 n=1 Tax=Acropora digitifera TaxID=70779 RepID=UPI00077AFC81|nr:PREDICTED: uncharacterized protein LOC107333832 [Acropora digitifera]